ncbi:hypothetical protein G9C85_11255 [Halorubellus sp. JP-L1]|uniref:hypothetical protein n=1 Tax=Halorubellus sp. JP-L1 TaxID=2715753 RepID=UPI00140BBCB2|nr:hypothetical protein [Halorubellus sp. JP-L1]NHN42198.1 hypothetical protein [Halorubellus sp. JP-L1]
MRTIPRWSKRLAIVLPTVPILGLPLLDLVVCDIGRMSGFFGLVLNVIGAVIIALPDVPRLDQYALPRDLRHSWRTFQDNKQLTPTDKGFESMVELINRQNGRLDYDRSCNLLNIDYKVYGNPSISAGFVEDDGKPPRYKIADWVTMQMWIEDVRDNVRASGFIIFMSGFMYQMLSYLL